MSPENQDNLRDIIDDAASALRHMEIPAGPTDQVLADTLSALAERQARHSRKRSIFSMRNLIKTAVAAVLLISAGVALWLIQPWGGQIAFADVLEKVQKIKAVRFKTFSEVRIAGMPDQKMEATVVIVGDRMRQDMVQGNVNMVSIMDLAAGEMLGIDHANKKVMRMQMRNIPREQRQSLLEQFRQMRAQDGTPIGKKELDGHKVEGFTVEKNGVRFTMWADVNSRLPVQVEMLMELPTMPRTLAVMKDFDWDVRVDPAQMSMTPPEGYDVQTMNFDAAPATEKDLIAGLRAMARLNGDRFPESFDMQGLTAIMKKLDAARPQGAAKAKELEKQMLSDMMTMSKGFTFVQPDSGDDFSYAGAGATLNEAKRPVFWYRPKESAAYHVIYADLTVEPVAADKLPKTQAKKLLSTQPATQPAK